MRSVSLAKLGLGIAAVAAAAALSACADVPLIGANHGEALPGDTTATGTAAADASAQAGARAGRAAMAKYSSSSTMAVLLDTPACRAVLEKHIPSVVNSNQISMARGISLKQVAGFGSSGITPQQLAAIDRDLARIR